MDMSFLKCKRAKYRDDEGRVFQGVEAFVFCPFSFAPGSGSDVSWEKPWATFFEARKSLNLSKRDEFVDAAKVLPL